MKQSEHGRSIGAGTIESEDIGSFACPELVISGFLVIQYYFNTACRLQVRHIKKLILKSCLGNVFVLPRQ